MPGPEVLYSVSGFVVAGLAGFVAYALAYAPPLVAAPSPSASPPPRDDEQPPAA
jgi:hypothetical protein